MRVIAGVGLRRGCAADEIVALVRRAERAACVRAAVLAAPAFRAGEAGLQQAASVLGLALVAVDAQGLEAVQADCPTRSALALRTVGLASVAEASALSAAGPGARLLLARIASQRATCALAGMAS